MPPFPQHGYSNNDVTTYLWPPLVAIASYCIKKLWHQPISIYWMLSI